MRPFTEVLLLLATAYTLLPLSFAKDFYALHSTVKHHVLQRGAAIRGLLVARQSDGCTTGYTSCSTTTCCPIAWDCCPDGNCCDPGSTCVLATNGIYGCCPIGELCSGPAGDPSTISLSQTPTTSLITSTTINHVTTSISTSVSTPLTSIFNPFTTPVQTIITSNPVQTIVTPTAVSGLGSLTQTQNPTTTATGLPRLSAAGRAEPYQPLLVLGGMLLAVLYCA